MRSCPMALALGLFLGARGASAHPSGHPSHHSHHSHVDLARYRSRVRVWHDGARVPDATVTPDGRMLLRMVSLNTHAVAEVTPVRPDGGFQQADCEAIARVLEDPAGHARTAIDRRLIEVVYQIARHFNAGQVTVVSGYRAASRRSNHQLGRAMDIVVPGVSDDAVAGYARSLGMVGVGLYPTGGFVHIDVRPASYFWVDRSGPGRSRRLHEVLGTLARRADANARARGVCAYGGTDGASDPAADGADVTDGSDVADGHADDTAPTH